MNLGYSFSIELDEDAEQPFIIELDNSDRHVQTLSGAIVLNLPRAESFKVATIAIHGHVCATLNIDTPQEALVHEKLVNNSTDLIAANDTEGRGVIRFEQGTQYIPFRIDLPHPKELPPTLINKLDTSYIDWKYEIHATLCRDHYFSTTRVVKNDLILRRPITPTCDNTIYTSIDREGQYKSKLTAPGRIVLGQDRLQAQVELKATNKEFMIKEVECAIIQFEEIDYVTKIPHPQVQDAQTPGAHCAVATSRLVSSQVLILNEESDLDFGHLTPIDFDIRIDNDQLIPTEQGLDWLNISHVLQYTLRFMDVNQPDLKTEIPLFVGNEVVSKENRPQIKPQVSSARLMNNLTIEGTEDHHLQHEKETTPEPEP